MPKETEIIKEKLDIAEFLRSYLQLIPAGKTFKALCPFHQEKTPSFIVSPDKKIWHCFGCGEGGDIISFVMKYENVEFPEALRMLAERAGIPMRNLSPTQEREFGILYDMHDAAAEFFRSELRKNEKAKKYLAERGLSNNTTEEFSLGYDPLGDALTLFLMQRKYSMQDILRAGLSARVRGLNRDRFEGRIIFPLYNSFGKIVGFAGRLFETPPGTNPDDVGKYVNSPETPIYRKSRMLYGFHAAKARIAQSRTVFLVEGNMDFLLAWQAGVKNAVAISGTALTAEHLTRLRRFADTALVSFDNDEAGVRALERGMDMFHALDFHVKAVSLGKYKDPADAVQKDPEFLSRAITEAKPAFQYVLERYFPKGRDTELDVPLRKRIIGHLLEKLKRMRSAVEQGIWMKKLSELSGIDETSLLEDLQCIKERPAAPAGTPEKREAETTRAELVARRLILFGFINPDFSAILKEHTALFPEHLRSAAERPDAEEHEMLRLQAAHELQGKDRRELEKEFDELIGYLELGHLEGEQKVLHRALRSAEAKGDESEVTRIAGAFSALSRKGQEMKAKARISGKNEKEKK